MASATPDADIARGTAVGSEERYRMQLAGLYAAVFGRAPTNAELDFYARAMLNNTPLAAVAENFLTSKEGLQPDMYPARESNDAYYRQLVSRVYAKALNRAPTSTELETAVAALNLGTLSRAKFIVDLTERVSRYEGSDAAQLADRNLFNNKIAVTLAIAKPNTTFDSAVGRMLLQSVTADASAQDAVQKALLTVQATAQLAQMNATIGVAAAAMPVEAARRTLARLYILVLNRLPDQHGMTFYLSTNPSTPAQWEAIAQGMLNSSEAATALGNWSGLSADAFVKKLYAQLAGSLPNGSNALTQLDGYTAAITGGKSRAAVVVDMARTMLDLADLNATDRSTKSLLDNRTAVAVTTGLYLPLSSAAQSAVLTAVTTTDIAAALAQAYTAASTDIKAKLTALRSDETAANVLAASINAVVSANTTAVSAAATLNGNAEAKLRLQMTEMYVGLLGRSPTNPPDVAGMQFYIDNGASLEAIAQGFITSSEGNALYGGLSNQQFVDKVYTTMLGSTSAISQGVRDGWVAKLAGANPPTRSKVAFDILNAVLGHHATNVDPVNAGLAAARSTFLLKVSDTYVKVEEKLNAEITRLSNLVGTLKTTADNLAAQLPSLQSTRDSTESTRASTASAATTALNGATAGDGRGVARLEVARLYGALLQRTTSNPPTLADLNLYAPYPLDQVAQWLLDSSEGRAIFPAGSTNTAFVNQLYLKVMGRAADTAGLNFWVNYLNNNASVANVRGKAAVEMMKGFMSYSDNKPAELTYKKTFDDKIASFLSTANSQASSAVTTAQNNVNYVNSLLAAIQQAQYDKTYWEGQVQSRSAAAAEGQEIIDKATARGTVSMIYGQLRGSYDYGGALFWIRQIHTTPSHSDTLISGLISEYPQANADFVKQLYSRVLSRTPSAAEVNWYVDLLNRGVVTKLAVAKDFMASPEGQGLMPAKKAAVETPLLNTAKAAVQAKTDAQTEVNKAITRLNTANSNYANCGMTQASANAALSAAQNAAAAMSAVVAAHPKVITADNAAITAANARVAYETKYAEWQAADTAYRNALNDPLRTKYSTAASLSAMIKNAASSRATLAQATATATANGAANVNGARVHQLVQLYVTVLNRAPTTAELLNALESLKASKPFNDVAKTLLQGSTYVGLSDDAFVTKLYAFAFSPTRPLGADEKKFWLDQLTAGVSREELVARFLRSTNDGGNSDTKTLNDRTITILNGLVAVPITDAETDKAIADSAAAARMALANGDAAGLAALEASPDGKRVMELAKLYQAIFNRAPDAPGLAFYLNALRSATPPSYEAIANALLVSAEGAAIFPATLSNADFVNKVFLSSFGRAATEGEKSLYGGQLATQSRGKVVQNIVEAVFKYPASDIAMLGAQARLHSNLAGNFAALQLDAQAYSNTANTAAALLSAAATAKVATLYTAALKIANSQTVTITQAGRRGTAMTTDRWGNVLSITDPRNPNYKVFYQYNHDNQQIDQTVYALGTGGGAAHAATRYDALGRIAATVDFRGNKNSYGFDSNGNMVKEYHADGSIVSSAYNLFGDRTSVEHPGSYGSVVRTEYEFDYLGRMTRSSSQNVMVTYSDHWKGDMGRKFIGFKQLNEYYRYDEMGQRIAVEYDEYSEHLSGAPVRTLLSKTYFDLAGNTIGTVNGGGFGTYSRFNALGQKTAEKDATNRRMSWTHDDFGRVLKHTDKGGAEVRYSYNALGQQTYLDSDVRAGYGKQEIEQVYEGGLLARIIDRGTKTETRYTYDLTGRRLTEQTAIVGADGLEELVQNNRISYDAQGRMSHVEDGRFKVDFEYDNNGNRVRVQTQYQDNAGKAVSTDVHSTYDVMNRALIINGSKVGNDVVIGTDGHRITYDDAGRRKSDTYMYKNQVTGNIEQTTEYFYYDNAGRLDQVVRDGVVVERRYYDELGRVIQTGPQENANADRLKAFGIPAVIQVYAYDSAGNLARMKSWTLGAKMLDDMYYRYKPTEGSGYDAAGTLHHHYVVSNSGVHTLTSNSHVYFDSAKEIQVTANRDGTIAHTFTQLDANGNVVGVSDTGAVKKNRTFINDAAGRVLRTTQDGKVTHTMIVNGEVFGSNSDTAVAANFGSAYQSALSGANTAAPTIYNVQSDGENLRSIAKQIWGDATLWYLIADANNLDADSALAVGQILKIPPRINTVHNDAETFNPYNASEAIGDTRPTLPEPKAKKGCGGVGQIVMIVVAVVATIYTGGAAAGLFMGQGAAALGFSAAMTMGTSLATAGLSFATVGGAIVGGALGSLASQAVGIAIGAQEKFNWKAVGMSALSAGMAPGGSALSSVVGTVASQAVTQAVASKLGLIEHFSWRNVAASVVGSMAGEAAGGAIKGSPIGQYIGKFGADFAKSVTRNAVSAAIGPQSFNWKDIATDAFGNALGQSLAAQIGGDSESRLAQQRRHARQAIASGGVDYIADKLIAGGMGIMEATVRSRSDAMQDTVGIIQSMNAAEQAAGVDFESLPVEQQNAILRGALANNSRSGPMLTEQLSRREAIVEAVDGGGYEGIPRLPDLAPVSIIGAVDLKTSFVRTGANVLDRTNGAVVELVNVVGQENATAAAFGIQLAVGGIPRTALSYAGNYILGGAKEDLSRKLSNLIADKGFDVQSAKPELASKIQIVSDALGRFGVEAAFSGASQFVHSAIDSRRMLNAAGVVGNTKTPEIGSKVNPGRVFWKDQIEFNGIKVYQRGDSFDPNKMTTWRQGGKVISGTNIERMATGRAPIGTDGKPVNLHHMTQSNDSAIAEMTQTFHQQNSKVIHINPNTIPSGIDRPAFDAWKARYWTDRAKNFGQ
jgi:YD repeat-containing protein